MRTTVTIVRSPPLFALVSSQVLTQISRCEALFLNYLPTPLVLLTDKHGLQAVHIAPEAFAVATAQFQDEIRFWQDALSGDLKGQLESVSPSHP